MTRRTRLFIETLDDRALPSFLGPVSYAVGQHPQAVVTGDFNGDGKLDIVTPNYNGSVSVLLGKGDGTFQSALASSTGVYSPSVAVGDFNGDGKLDLATTTTYGDVNVLLGKGDGTFQAPAGIGIGSSAASVAVGDFNGDGKMDLGVASNDYVIDGYAWNYYGYYPFGHYEGKANVLLGNGDGSFSPPNVTGLGSGYNASAGAADLNGDGFDDLVTVADSYLVNVLLGDDSGYLQYHSALYTGGYSYSVAAGDLNTDGHTDLVTAHGYSGASVGVLLGDGAGGFSAPTNYATYATGGGPTSVVLGDFTADGKVDVATANYYSDTVSVLYGNGDGTLSAAVNSYAGTNPLRLAAGDFNGDGWLDAAAANTGSSCVSVLINDHSWPTPPAPHVSINDVTVTEGNTGTTSATFTLSLSVASGVPVTVHYATADGTATVGSDYTAASGDVTFAPGETSKTVTVKVIGDRLLEPSETFVVNLSSPTNGSIADGQGIGTIVDDEPRISISDVTKKEGRKNHTTLFTFTVSLSAAYDQAVTISFKTTDGTAKTSDSDYVAKSGTITFNPGETSKTITIVVNGDNKRESDEVFYLDLSGNSSNSLFTKNRGIGTILNDD